MPSMWDKFLNKVDWNCLPRYVVTVTGILNRLIEICTEGFAWLSNVGVVFCRTCCLVTCRKTHDRKISIQGSSTVLEWSVMLGQTALLARYCYISPKHEKLVETIHQELILFLSTKTKNSGFTIKANRCGWLFNILNDMLFLFDLPYLQQPRGTRTSSFGLFVS